ncbi:MAG: response regulator [Vicinamibacterales bacterium]
MIRLLLVDDHTLVRAGIRALLETVDGVSVVGEGGSGEEALALARTLRPDIVILDLSMPGLNGFEAADALRAAQPGVRVIVLSMHSGSGHIHRALESGVAAYLLKEAAVDELPLAIHAVMRGERFLSPGVASQLLDGLAGRRIGSPLDQLTPRQREILQHIAEGHSTKETAHRLGVSVKTVETHRRQLMERLQIHDVAGLVRLAVRVGLVTDD